jgi:hypothetical protein
MEIAMQNILTIGTKHIPIEQIAYVEVFDTAAGFKSDKPYKTRLVLLNRNTVLTEQALEDFARMHRFRLLAEDHVATNPIIMFEIEGFVPTEDFKPGKPYQTRLVWHDPIGGKQSRLLVTKPEAVIALALRGQS